MDLSNIFHIMAKDARTSLRNLSLLIIVGIAILLPLMMGAMSGSISSIGNQTVNIAYLDRGDSHNYTDYLRSVPLFNVTVAGSVAEMNESIKGGAIAGGIEIPERFDSDIAAGLKPTISLFVDPSNIKSAVFTQSVVAYTMSYAGLRYPVDVQTYSVVQQPQGSTGTSFTGFSAPTLLLISILIVGISVLPATLTTEKEKKTITALLASPVTQMDVIFGKALYGLLLTVIISLIVLMLGNSLTGNVPLALLFVFLGALAFNGIGLLIAIYANSYQTASIISSVIMVPMMMFTFLYGFIDQLKVVGVFVPSTYLMNGLNDAIIYDRGIAGELVNLGAFAAITVAIYAVIYASLRRRGLAS